MGSKKQFCFQCLSIGIAKHRGRQRGTVSPRYSRGVTFLESPANTKTADSKGALYVPKFLFFKTK